MGILSRLFKFFDAPAEQGRRSTSVDVLNEVNTPAPVPTAQVVSPPELGVTMTVTLQGMPDLPDVEVTEADVSNALATCRFVLDRRIGPLRASEQWWNEEAHNRRVKAGSPKATLWLEPFVPVNIIQGLPLASATNPRGPLAAGLVVKELRAAVRERRKAKQPFEDLLRALHAACVLEAFIREMPFEFVYANQLSCHLTGEDWRAVPLDYQEFGYAHIPPLAKTDIKWLVDAFGEPRGHRSPAEALATIRETAISRYCWSELTRENESFRAGTPRSMEAWLRQRLAGTVRIRKENEALMARRLARKERDERMLQDLPRAWAATEGTFVIADLETTGWSAENDDILEFGAVRVSPEGQVLSEFSALVNVGHDLPPFISRLTGITDDEVRRTGRPLHEAFKAFTDFAQMHPVFFHNSHFDEGFLGKAAKRVGHKLAGPVFDTLMLARAAWPDVESLKLKDLAEKLGTQPPTHRAVGDAKAALEVLLAAREQAHSPAQAPST
ncbi:3'-5' exonuclease [Variovorax sp. GT1P44]|uniref:3'-5' exonuclease n=1 Tax=Variovorax sp. GT1P44 TaxID=3443742 RepID=UPI003F480ED7